MNLNLKGCQSGLTGVREVTLYHKLERVLPPRVAGCARIIRAHSCREPPIDTNLCPRHPVRLETDLEKGSGTKSRNGPTGGSHFWCLPPFPDQTQDNHDRFDANLDYQPRRQHHLPELTRGRRLPPHG
jgi:hypothetical protein